jgi:Flp pilus assembly protein TadB
MKVMATNQHDDAVLITSVPESRDREFGRRKRKYTIMMGLRVLCVIGLATTYRISIWLAVAFVIAGAALPWCAVLIANDRPAKKAMRLNPFAPRPTLPALPPRDP